MKITKKQEKQLGEIPDHLKQLIDSIVKCPENDLLKLLRANMTWGTSKGTLLNWIPVLNNFDDTLQRVTTKYHLEKEFVKPVELSPEDTDLLVAILDFTHLLLSNCTVKSAYASSHRLFDLLNSPTIPVIICVLQIFSVLGKKFSIKSSKRTIISSRKVSDRLYPFALSLSSSTLASHSGKASDSLSLIDFTKDNLQAPKKWKRLEYIYYNNGHDGKLKENSALESVKKIANQESLSTSATPSPLKKRKSQNKDDRVEIAKAEALQGARSLKFLMGEDDVRKLTVQQIFDKGSEKLPPKSWQRFWIKTLLAKAFNSNSYDNIKLRQELIIIKCLAVSILVSVHTDYEVTARIFEADPTLLGSLVDLINLNNSVPKSVRLAAIRALDCISAMKTWSSEIVRNLGGSVSHGLLFQNLRNMKAQLKYNETERIDEEFNLHYFSLVSNLVEMKSMSHLLVSAGLIQNLAELLTVKSDFKVTLAGGVHLLDTILNGNSENVSIFRENEGFISLVDRICQELDFALANPGYGGGPPTLSIVHYSISFKQANYLRSLLRLAHHLIQKESGDSVRNLFDSPLLQSLNKIITNISTFGYTLLTLAISISTSIIHNEPTSFMILKEAGTIDILLKSFGTFFGKSGELLSALPNVIGAVALNNEGLKMVIEHKVIEKFFTIFDSNDLAKVLVNDDLSDLLSGSVDELARHFPQFKSIIIGEVVNLIERLPEVGTKDLPTPCIYRSEKGAFYSSPEEEVINNEEGAPELATWESISQAYILENASVFIGNLIMFSNTWTGIMDGLPFEKWIPLICLRKSPFDYFYSNAMYPLNGALKYFDDEKRDYCGSHVVDKVGSLLEVLGEFSLSTSKSSIFLTQNIDDLDTLFNNLISINNVLFAFTDVYCNPSSLSVTRVEQLSHYFSTDKGTEILHNLGALLNRCAFEEFNLRTSMPTSVANETAVGHFDDGFPPLRIIFEEIKEQNQAPKTSAKYKNSVQVRFTLHRILSSICTIFGTLAELPSTTKQDQTFNKFRGEAVKVANEIGIILSNLLINDLYQSPSLHLVIVHAVLYCLTNSTSDKVLTVGAIMFMQAGGYIKLQQVLQHYWSKLTSQDNSLLKNVKGTPYIKDTPESIVVAIVLKIFEHLNKISVYELALNVQHGQMFYEGDFDGAFNVQASNLRASFIVQTKILSIGCLNAVFNEDVLDSLSDDVQLPLPIVEEIIKLVKNVYSASGTKELNMSDGSLFQLDWKQARISHNRVGYLKRLGFSQEEAIESLSKSDGGLTFLKLQDLPEGFKDLSRWKDIRKNFKSNPYHLPEQHLVMPQFRDCQTFSQLEQLRIEKSEYLLDQLYLLAQLHPKVTHRVSEFLTSSVLLKNNVANFDTVMLTIVEFIFSFEFPDEDSPRLAAMLTIFGSLVANNQVFYGCHNAIGIFIEGVVEHLSPQNINTDWAIEIMAVFERLVAWYNVPEFQKLNVPVATPLPESLPVPPKLDPGVYEKVFSILLTSNVENARSCFHISKLLGIYASKPENIPRITGSGIIKRLIVHVGELETNDEDVTRTAPSKSVMSQIAFTTLVRRCFESKDFITDQVVREISKQFTSRKDGSKDKPKDLALILRDAFGVIMRSPEIFVDEFVKHARLSNFSEPLRSWLTVFCEPNEKDRQPQDSTSGEKMADNLNAVEPTAQFENQTGIVHLILSELMNASKNDWISDPPLTDEERKKKEKEERECEFPKQEKVEITKNKFCKRILFLLKLLSELLSSYKQSKIEFLTFSKKQLFQSKINEPIKPRSTSLNFLLHQFISGPAKDHSPGTNSRRVAVAKQTSKVIVAFISSLDTREIKADAKRVDPDLTFVRKFTIDTIQKMIKDINASNSVLETRYWKLVSVCEIIPYLLANLREKLVDPLTAEFDDYHMAKILLDSELVSTLSQVLSEIDLNHPEYYFTLQAIVNIFNNLGSIKNDRQDLFRDSQPNNGADEEEVEEDENDFKEETPDLFQNSTLGMYDVAEIDSEEEFSDDDIGFNEGDVSDDDEPDDDDIDEDIMGGRDLEIVYSEDDDEDHDGDIIISSDEGETVADSDEEMDDPDSASASASESDSYIEYDFDQDGEELEQREFDSELDISDDNDDFYVGSGSEIDQERYEIADSESESVQADNLDSELEEEMEHIIAEDEHERDIQRIPGMSSRGGFPAPAEEYFTDDDELGFDDDDDEDASDTDDYSEEEYMVAGNSGRSHQRTYHNRRPRSGEQSLDQRLSQSLRDGLSLGPNAIIDIRPGGGQILTNEMVSGILNRGMITHGHGGFRSNENFSVMSTRERWVLFATHTYNKSYDYFRILYPILNGIYEPSKELFELKKKEKEDARRAQEEEEQRLLEEAKRNLEETSQDQAANESNDSEMRDASTSEEDEQNEEARVPVLVRIGDREVDIAGTDIDPEFFEALPEDMREEVFTQHIREQRALANQPGNNAPDIDEAFLDALPEDIREDILAQEASQARFSLALSPAVDRPGSGSDSQDTQQAVKEKQKVFYTPLLDVSGVASLIRYVFVPQSFNGRKPLYNLMAQICTNKKTRAEVLGYLVAILQYGISDQETLEKTFTFISSIAQQCERPSTPKTGTSSTSKVSAQSLFPSRSNPFTVACQALEALQYLLESEPQLRYYFLTEHEGVSFGKRPPPAKKPSQLKPSKFPLNTLLSLLNKGLIRERSNLMDLLSRIIQITTRPLNALKKAQAQDKKNIDLPSVHNSSLRNVITILVSDDCSSRTFQQTLSAMQNLLVVCPGGKTFASELSKDAKNLGDRLTGDLKALHEDLSKHADSKEYDGEILSKFTSSNSDQSKLLRVLTALDYLFGKSKNDEVEEVKKSELTIIYDSLQLGELWGALSETLELFEANKHITNMATILLPVIESLMVICKHSKVKDIQNKESLKYEDKKVDFATEPIENLFFAFTDAHKKILNTMVRSNPKLMSGPFTMLVSNPRVLEFDNKKNYFDRQLHSDSAKEKQNLQITVTREQVFLDSYRALFFKSKEQFRDSKLEITFKGEAGVDAGGVTREWYQVLSRQMFNPDYALFLPIASDKTTFHPNRTSFVNPEHLSFFKFIGRIIGKAIYDNCFLDCHFTRDVYKSILGRPVSLKDLETIDLEYYKSLIWMLDNDITDVIIETFSVETEDYGEQKVIDLIPDGRNIAVTEDNKNEYVRLVVEYRLQKSVEEQVDNFLQGFHEIIPKELIAIFDEQELELLISGLPDIDVDDWKNNTVYVNYTAASKEVGYFWRAVRSFDKEERAKLLQFATGTSKVPLNGFKELEGSNGSNKFSIHKDFGSTDRLPSSHTCFNQIDLPAYDSYEQLRGSLLLALTEGHEGFGIA